MTKKVVCNSTPVISLCSVGCDHVLRALFGRVIVAKAVAAELQSLKKPGSEFPDNAWVEVSQVGNIELVKALTKDLDPGEAETIALARELKADVVIIDENAGYRIAKLLDLPVVRTLSVLKVAKKRKVISAIRPIVEEMVLKGRWYSARVVENFLSEIGE